MSQGSLERIWIKRARRGPMDLAERARVVAGAGLVGNANQGGHRQVAILDAAAWQRACAELGRDVDPSTRRANLLVRGLELARSRGRVLRVGPVRMRVFEETKPCELMDHFVPGLRAALRPEWRGGVSVEVLDDGEIALGDAVRWDDAEPRAQARATRQNA
jgi:MOSC domain-containing protein YiiM